MKEKPSPKKRRRRLSAFLSIDFGRSKEREYFIENLGMLLSSGMNILTALRVIKEDVHSKKMRQAITDLEDKIEEGSPLWRAFARVKIVPENIVSLIRIGEETGKLTDNLKVIALQQEKERVFRSKIRSAMMYPVMVLSLTVIIGIGIAWFILPRLALVFAQLNMELPLITRLLIGFGRFLGKYGIIVVPSFLFIFAAGLYFIFIFPKTKFIGQAILFRFPIVKNLVREVELSRFGYLLGTLLQAGLPVTNALDSIYKTDSFYTYKNLYFYLRESINEGNSFQKSFASYKAINRLIPPPIRQMIVTAEQSGQLPETLLRIGRIFENKTESTTKNLTVVLEPLLLVIVWAGVVSVALAVILPIYSLIGGLNTESSVVPSPPSVDISTQPEKPVSQPNSGQIESIESGGDFAAQNTQTQLILGKLKILPTELGYLNVREDPSLDEQIIAKVYPGEEYEYTDEEEGWYEIIFSEDGEAGWVYGRYVKIVSSE